MKVIYYMPNRVVGAKPPGVAGLLSRNMIPRFLKKGVDMIACANDTLIDVPIFKGSIIDCVVKTQPDIVYNLVAEEHLNGIETFLIDKKIKYVGDATHGKFMPHESMIQFDFICQSQLLYDRLTERRDRLNKKRFKAHRVPPFVPTSEIPTEFKKEPSSGILYLHNGDKGIQRSIEVCQAINKRLYVTIAPIPANINQKCVTRFGCVDVEKKKALINTTEALIYCPPDNGFIEATCTSAMECLLSGLPIIGVPNRFGRSMCVFQYIEEGNIPSVIRDTPEELIQAIKDGELAKINKREVWEKAKVYFNQDRSINEYIKVFEKLYKEKLVSECKIMREELCNL